MSMGSRIGQKSCSHGSPDAAPLGAASADRDRQNDRRKPRGPPQSRETAAPGGGLHREGSGEPELARRRRQAKASLASVPLQRIVSLAQPVAEDDLSVGSEDPAAVFGHRKEIGPAEVVQHFRQHDEVEGAVREFGRQRIPRRRRSAARPFAQLPARVRDASIASSSPPRCASLAVRTPIEQPTSRIRS